MNNECPGPECPMCNGEMCNKCGAGCWSGPMHDSCEHDVTERHEVELDIIPMTGMELRQQNEKAWLEVKNLRNKLEEAQRERDELKESLQLSLTGHVTEPPGGYKIMASERGYFYWTLENDCGANMPTREHAIGDAWRHFRSWIGRGCTGFWLNGIRW